MYSINFKLNSYSLEDTYNLKSEIISFFLTRKYVKNFCSLSNFTDGQKSCVGRVDIKPFSRKRLENDLATLNRVTYKIVKE